MTSILAFWTAHFCVHTFCCKQKFLYRFFIINMTRNISETNVINCYWMKLCNMVKILTCLVCCVNCICHVLHKKRSNSTPQHEVTFYRGHRLHSVISVSNITRFSNYCYSNTRCRLLVITLNLLNIMCSFAGIDINLNLIL